MRKSDDEDNYSDWVMLFEEKATEENGFNEDEDLDHDLMDELYDEDMDVYEALSEYHQRN